MKVVPNPEYGQVYSIESHGGVVAMTYKMTIGVEPNCTKNCGSPYPWSIINPLP